MIRESIKAECGFESALGKLLSVWLLHGREMDEPVPVTGGFRWRQMRPATQSSDTSRDQRSTGYHLTSLRDGHACAPSKENGRPNQKSYRARLRCLFPEPLSRRLRCHARVWSAAQ